MIVRVYVHSAVYLAVSMETDSLCWLLQTADDQIHKGEIKEIVLLPTGGEKREVFLLRYFPFVTIRHQIIVIVYI